MPPGTRVLAITSRWFDEGTVATVFEPLVADWQREWRDASGSARFVVRIRGASALFISMIAASPSVWRAPSPAGTMRRVVRRLTLWTMVFTSLGVIPFVTQLGRKFDTAIALSVFVLLLPQAVALAFPMAITTVVDLIRTAPRPTREERIAALRLAIAASALLLVVDGWVFPAANQQYRVMLTRAAMGDTYDRDRGPAPGKNELSIAQLARYSLQTRPGDRFDSEYALRELNRRVCLIAMPVFFIWTRWRALLLPRGRWYSAAPLIVSAPLLIVCWYALLLRAVALADIFYLPRWTGPWLSFALMGIAAIAVDCVRRRAARTA